MRSLLIVLILMFVSGCHGGNDVVAPAPTEPAYEIAGIVLDRNGHPAGGAEVWARRNGEELARTKASRAGLYRLRGLPGGEIEVWALKPYCEGYRRVTLPVDGPVDLHLSPALCY